MKYLTFTGILLNTLINLYSQADTLSDTILKPIELYDTIKVEIMASDSLIPDTVEYIKDTIVIAGVGDIMPGTNFPSSRFLPPNNDCFPLMNAIKHELSWQDITFGNLEGVFAGNVGTAKKCNDTLNCYAFRMPDTYIDCIVDAGFDILSVANNHVGDFGHEGRERTARILSEKKIYFSGFTSHPYIVFDTNNITYAFIAYSTSPGTNMFTDYSQVKKTINHLDTIADIVIVSFHGGAEGKAHQHVTRKKELFFGTDRGNVYEFAHLAVDAGADIIYGHGPHVIRAVEVYKNRFIAYSLGNFCTYARFNLTGPNGISPIINTYVNPRGEFLKAEVISTRQQGEGITILDPTNSAFIKLKELTQIDFPENRLIFENNQIKLSK